MKLIRILSIFLKYSFGGEGSACRTWVILEISKLLETQTRPIGLMFRCVQFWASFLTESNLLPMLVMVMFSMSFTSYSIPRAVNLLTQSRLFSRQYRRSVSLIGPILMTFVLLKLIFKPDLW